MNELCVYVCGEIDWLVYKSKDKNSRANGGLYIVYSDPAISFPL